MSVAQRLDHYAKAIITATGLIVLLVANYAAVFPADWMPYINGVVTGLTIFGTWWKKNGPAVVTELDRLDGDATT